jgi:cation diffusion facilitator family transporter
MAESKTAVAAAFAGNAALAVLKGVGAAVTGSAAMLAECFHSIADTGNQALLFLGMRLGARPRDRAHPFGHGKDVYFWAFVVAVMLFSLGGAFSIWEAVRKILHPSEHGTSIGWTYGVLGGGFVFESISLGVAVHAVRKEIGGRSFREFWRDNRDPTLPTVLLEDSAALLSLVVAATGIALSHVTGVVTWDAVASAVIGLLLIGVAIVLAFENHSLLIGERAAGETETRIRDAVARDEAVRAVTALHTMHQGPRSILVVVGVDFVPGLTTEAIEAAVRRLHGRIHEAIGGRTDSRLIVIEPARDPEVAFGSEASGRRSA